MKWAEGNEKRKWAIILTAALVALVSLGLWKNLTRGIFMGDVFLCRKSDTLYQSKNYKIQMEQGDGEVAFAITAGEVEKSAKLVKSGDGRIRITFEDGDTVEGKWEKDWGEYGELVNEKGEPFWLDDWGTDALIPAGEQVPAVYKGELATALCRMSGGITEIRGSVWGVVVSTLIYILGALSFLFPNETFFFLSRWRYKEPQLSEEGLFAMQFDGIMGMVLALFSLLLRY